MTGRRPLFRGFKSCTEIGSFGPSWMAQHGFLDLTEKLFLVLEPKIVPEVTSERRMAEIAVHLV